MDDVDRAKLFPTKTSRFEAESPVGLANCWPPLMPTSLAAAYCGYASPAGLRKAKFDGKVKAVGRRGGGGPLMWRRQDLDAFLAGAVPTVALKERTTSARRHGRAATEG